MENNSFFETLYNDGILLIINKPPGLLTHRSNLSSDRNSVVDRLKDLYIHAPSPIHRLDRPTSGVLVSSFTREAARILGISFVEGKVKKSYLAIVRGHMEETGSIDIPLKKDGEGDFQRAFTNYRTIKKFEIPVANNKYKSSRYSLIQVKPETGRFHQIRRHLARTGHPVIGDTSHGDLRHNRIFEKYFSIKRLLLHSESITFPHPMTSETLTVSAPIPIEMQQIIEAVKEI